MREFLFGLDPFLLDKERERWLLLVLMEVHYSWH